MQDTDYKLETLAAFNRVFNYEIELFQPYHLLGVDYLCLEDIFPSWPSVPEPVFFVLYMNYGILRFPELVEMNGYRYVTFDIINVFVEMHYKISEYKSSAQPTRTTYTYIMYDQSTDYYKIGQSVSPTRREKTLQAEKPTIDLILLSPNNIEFHLHAAFKAKRIRGEWFKLDADDILLLIEKYGFTTPKKID